MLTRDVRKDNGEERQHGYGTRTVIQLTPIQIMVGEPPPFEQSSSTYAVYSDPNEQSQTVTGGLDEDFSRGTVAFAQGGEVIV